MTNRTRHLEALALALAFALLGLAGSARPLAADNDNPAGISRSELGRLDLFLDNHPDIAQELTANPALATNRDFVSDHPAWKAFLEDHPTIREGLRANPSVFMRVEDRFDSAEARHEAPKGRAAQREAMADRFRAFDKFLDQHPAIAKQLETNPSLIKEKAYVADHPELEAFLKDKPELRDSLLDNPQAFMKGVAAADAAEAKANSPAPKPVASAPSSSGSSSGTTASATGGTKPTMPPTKAPPNNSNEAATRTQVAAIDNFLDASPRLAKQLEAKPWLVNDTSFLQQNPKLVDFLKDNPGIRDKWRADPALIMSELGRFDQIETAAAPHMMSEAQVKSDMGKFEDFLDQHPVIAKQLKDNPSLLSNKDFLKSSPELAAFLQDNAGIRSVIAANPNAFLKGAAAVEATEAKTPAPKPTMPPTKAPPAPDNDSLNRSEIASVDNFLDSNSALTKQLQANPSLINDRDFLKDHPDLVVFLKNHPDLAGDWRANPSLTIGDLRRMDQLEAARSIGREQSADIRSAVQSFDNFLDNHPLMEAQIEHHSSLASNMSFIDSHPELKAYLQKNPAVAAQLRNNPKSFMSLLSKLDKQETLRAEKKEDLKPKHK